MYERFTNRMREFQSDCIVKYKIRNEFWTKEKSKEVSNRVMGNML